MSRQYVWNDKAGRFDLIWVWSNHPIPCGVLALVIVLALVVAAVYLCAR